MGGRYSCFRQREFPHMPLSPEINPAHCTESPETSSSSSEREGIRDRQCTICLRYFWSLFPVGACPHRYCKRCIIRHATTALALKRVPIKCPGFRCIYEMNYSELREWVFTRSELQTYNDLLREASIPMSERVYCPYPRCSFLMKKGVDREQTTCRKCKRLFCEKCLVPWHEKMTCRMYQGLPRRDKHVDDAQKLQVLALAKKKKWQKCEKCNSMYERRGGCAYVTCKCGYLCKVVV